MDFVEKVCVILSKKHFDCVNNFDKNLITNTIINRLRNSKFACQEEYLKFLDNDKSEADQLFFSFYITYSEFFRNKFTFAILEKQILPNLFNNKRESKDKEIKIWSAAAASGQEAYSISILLYELKSLFNNNLSYSIHATDIIEDEVRKAQSGAFHAQTLDNVPFSFIKKHFISENDHFTVKSHIKKDITFSIFDLTNPDYIVPNNCVFGCYDIIFCSNVIMYYSPQVRKNIIEKLLYTLCDDGYIICDEAEIAIFQSLNLKQAYPNSAIFKKF